METITGVAGLLGALAGLITAVVGLLAVLEKRAKNGGRKTTQRGAAVFRQLSRPLPIALGAAALAVVSGLLLREWSQSGRDERGTSVRLLRQLVGPDGQRCRETARPRNAIATLSCAVEKPMSTLKLSLFSSVDAVRRAEREELKRSGLVRGACRSQ